jgi:hypothetical protein
MRDLDRDYRAHGVDAIEKLRKNEPMNYFRLLVSLVPRELPTGDDFLKLLTDEELDTLIKYLREATAAEKAKIEQHNEAACSAPHEGSHDKQMLDIAERQANTLPDGWEEYLPLVTELLTEVGDNGPTYIGGSAVCDLLAQKIARFVARRAPKMLPDR